MSRYLILFGCLCCNMLSQRFDATAQTPDWSTTIASIVYNNCSSCHHPGTSAPFSLLSYADAEDRADDIQEAVMDMHMPPWPADPNYRHFAYEAVLEPAEIQAIDDWVNGGMPLGNTALEPPAPTYNNTGSQLASIDYVVAIEQYTLQFNDDEYRWFVMPTNFTDTVYVQQIEVRPGVSLVHHADLAYDLTGNSMARFAPRALARSSPLSPASHGVIVSSSS